jgi:hypothetical protein
MDATGRHTLTDFEARALAVVGEVRALAPPPARKERSMQETSTGTQRSKAVATSAVRSARGNPAWRHRVSGFVTAMVLSGCFAAALTAPSAAQASVERWYCDDGLNGYEQNPNWDSCPPVGSSHWLHLNTNAGFGETHRACIDEFLKPSGSGYYTGATCASAGVFTEQFPGHTWGYPRIWNGYCCGASNYAAYEYEK